MVSTLSSLILEIWILLSHLLFTNRLKHEVNRSSGYPFCEKTPFRKSTSCENVSQLLLMVQALCNRHWIKTKLPFLRAYCWEIQNQTSIGTFSKYFGSKASVFCCGEWNSSVQIREYWRPYLWCELEVWMVGNLVCPKIVDVRNSVWIHKRYHQHSVGIKKARTTHRVCLVSSVNI